MAKCVTKSVGGKARRHSWASQGDSGIGSASAGAPRVAFRDVREALSAARALADRDPEPRERWRDDLNEFLCGASSGRMDPAMARRKRRHQSTRIKLDMSFEEALAKLCQVDGRRTSSPEGEETAGEADGERAMPDDVGETG